MHDERFFRHELLPFVEARYSRHSSAPFKPHLHRAFSIGAVDRGEVLYQVADEGARLVPGTLALINPDTLHACNPPPGERRSYYMLYLDIRWCARVQQSLWQVDCFVPTTTIRLDDAALYREYCQTMDRLMAAEVFLDEKEQLLYNLACRVFHLSCSLQQRAEPPDLDISRLKGLLERDLQKDLPLERLAAEMGANPYTLLRRFRQITGITPHAFRMNCRIEMARRFLQEGRDITETAYLCGFFDQSHLHRHFKAMTTVTPKEYLVNFVQ